MANMKHSDMKNIIDIITIVSGLKESSDVSLTGTFKLDSYEKLNKLANEIRKVLHNYLSVLDYESIKVIKTVMCLGKYEDYESNWEDIYGEYSKSLIDSWQTKELEVEFLKNELNIDSYLKRGLEIICSKDDKVNENKKTVRKVGIKMFKRTVKCPYCDNIVEVDCEDYVVNSASYERNMGEEIEYEIEMEDVDCECCGKVFVVKGSIWEYPIGAYNYDTIKAYVR